MLRPHVRFFPTPIVPVSRLTGERRRTSISRVEFACPPVSRTPYPLAVPPTPWLPSVLVVEEHHEMRSALRAWLLTSFPPLRLHEARSMDEARESAGQALDLALVNLELPGPNGIEVARMLRTRQPGCRVVVMSVNDSTVLRTAALAAGAHAFVSKRDLRIALHPIMSMLLKAP